MMNRQLAATYIEAMRLWDLQKAENVPLRTRLAGLERTLRAAWPQTRVWHYLCEQCSDHGLIMYFCKGSDCGQGRVPHEAHEYGRPCSCVKGARFRDAPASVNDVQQAGKVRKGLTRIGR